MTILPQRKKGTHMHEKLHAAPQLTDSRYDNSDAAVQRLLDGLRYGSWT